MFTLQNSRINTLKNIKQIRCFHWPIRLCILYDSLQNRTESTAIVQKVQPVCDLRVKRTIRGSREWQKSEWLYPGLFMTVILQPFFTLFDALVWYCEGLIYLLVTHTMDSDTASASYGLWSHQLPPNPFFFLNWKNKFWINPLPKKWWKIVLMIIQNESINPRLW